MIHKVLNYFVLILINLFSRKSGSIAFFFFCDGVLNKSIIRNGKPFAPSNINEFKIYKHIKKINQINENIKVFVVSNQPDVGHGKILRSEIEKMNHEIKKYLNVDDFFYCYHRQFDNCFCRKPSTGLILKALIKHKLNLKNSFFIGDRKLDMDLASSIGCKSVFIDRNYSETSPKKEYITKICFSTKECIEYLINQV